MSAAENLARRAQSRPSGQSRGEGALLDLRFRTLVGEEAWSQLPLSVQQRFSKCFAPGEAVIYRGHVAVTELSRVGRLLAFLARLVGGPLPLTHGARGAAVVIVTEDAALGGQCWTRMYSGSGWFPQVVNSVKRFAGPTGLEEYVGYGIGMALKVTVEGGALVFRSERYFFEIGRRRLRFPRALAPGVMEIVHREEMSRADGAFSFSLSLTHGLLGRLVYQQAYFRDA